MYKLKELTDNDVLRHELSIRCAYQVYGDVVGSFYLLEKDGKESILHNEDNIFMIIDELDGKVSYTMFAVDDNFELSDLGYPEFEFHLLDKEYVFLDRETGKSYSIALNERADGEDVELGFIFVHGQDHLMTTILLRDILDFMFDIYK